MARVTNNSETNGEIHPIDLYVGGRIRMRRKVLGMSQGELADAIGLTFQQIQKYERGANRVSASKLYDISVALKVPVAYLFEGYGSSEASHIEHSDELLHAFLMTNEGVALADAFTKITSRELRHQVLGLVRALAKA